MSTTRYRERTEDDDRRQELSLSEFIACCQKCGEVFSVLGRYVDGGGRCMAELQPHRRLVGKDSKAYHYLPPGSPGGGKKGKLCGRLLLAPMSPRVRRRRE